MERQAEFDRLRRQDELKKEIVEERERRRREEQEFQREQQEFELLDGFLSGLSSDKVCMYVCMYVWYCTF